MWNHSPTSRQSDEVTATRSPKATAPASCSFVSTMARIGSDSSQRPGERASSDTSVLEPGGCDCDREFPGFLELNRKQFYRDRVGRAVGNYTAATRVGSSSVLQGTSGRPPP